MGARGAQVLIRLAAAGVLAASAVAAAACVGTAAADPIAEASAATAKERTMQVRYEVDSATTHGTGTGVFDAKAHTGSMSMTVDVAGQEVRVNARMRGTAIYMSSPLFARLLPAGKTWLKIDLQKAGEQQGVDFSALLGNQSEQQLGQLRAATGLKKVGEEQVAGVATTHYSARVDLDEAAKRAATPAAADSYRQLKKLAGTKTLPFDVWIDGDHHLRRFSERYSVKVPGSGTTEQKITMTYVAFGIPVHVAIPPAAKVLDATDTSKLKS